MSGIGFSYRKYIAVIALQIVLVMTVLDVTVVIARAIQGIGAACVMGVNISFALYAGIFSYTRTIGHKSELHM